MPVLFGRHRGEKREFVMGAREIAVSVAGSRQLADKNHYVTVMVRAILLMASALALCAGIIIGDGVAKAKRERNELESPSRGTHSLPFSYLTEKVLLPRGMGVPAGGSAGGVASAKLRVVDGFSRVEKGGMWPRY
jgi:hypothetical protein